MVNAAAVFLGLLGGWLFQKAWQFVLPAGRIGGLVQSVDVHFRGMAASEEPSALLKHYRELLKGIVSFTARTLLAVVAGIVPVTVLYWLLTVLARNSQEQAGDPWKMSIWPHLTGPELTFFLAVSVSSVVAALWALGKREKK